MGEARGGARRVRPRGRLLLSRARLHAARVGALLATAAVACSLGGAPGRDDPEPLRAVWDVAQERFVDEATLVQALSSPRYVLLGEVHDNPGHHRLQARWIRSLVSAGRRPAVVFEMISRDEADALAAAQAVPGAGPRDLAEAVHWEESGWPPFPLYAPIFAAALEAGLPLAAGDLGSARRKILRDDGVAGLEPRERAELGLDSPTSAAQRDALAAAIRSGHCDLLPETAVEGMIDFQRGRDAQLARSLVDAAGRDGAVLVAGAQHVRRDVAVPFWLARLDPGAAVVSIALVEGNASDLGDALPAPAAFDYVVLTPRTEREDPCEHLRRRLEGA